MLDEEGLDVVDGKYYHEEMNEEEEEVRDKIS